MFDGVHVQYFGERRQLTADFSTELAAISTPADTITGTPEWFVDKEGITVDGATNTTSSASVWISDGTGEAANSYTLTSKVTTTGGSTLIKQYIVGIADTGEINQVIP